VVPKFLRGTRENETAKADQVPLPVTLDQGRQASPSDPSAGRRWSLPFTKPRTGAVTDASATPAKLTSQLVTYAGFDASPVAQQAASAPSSNSGREPRRRASAAHRSSAEAGLMAEMDDVPRGPASTATPVSAESRAVADEAALMSGADLDVGPAVAGNGDEENDMRSLTAADAAVLQNTAAQARHSAANWATTAGEHRQQGHSLLNAAAANPKQDGHLADAGSAHLAQAAKHGENSAAWAAVAATAQHAAANVDPTP